MDDDVETPIQGPAMQRLREMADIITAADLKLTRISSTRQDIRRQAGFAAEEGHALGFNLDAIHQDSEARAYTDRDECFYETESLKNGPTDILMVDNTRTASAQVKYHGDPGNTAAALREPDASGKPKYLGKQLIVASDHADAVCTAAHRTRLKEEGSGRRPHVADAARMVEDNASDQLVLGCVRSTPISLHESRQLARNPHGPERRAIEEPYVTQALASVILETQRTAQPFDPHNPFKGDAWDRLVKNGTVECVPENADADGNFSIEYTWYSDDPEHTIEDLDARERTHGSIARAAVQAQAALAAFQAHPFLDGLDVEDKPEQVPEPQPA